MTETDLVLSDGRTLHVYDTGADDDGLLAVFLAPWHAEHRRASRAAVPRRRSARHPLGVVRPSGIWRVDTVPRANGGIGGR